MLKFETRRIANSYGDKTRYRAILKSHGSVVDFDTVLKEVEEYGGINPVTMRYYLDTFFNCVRKKMLEDGRSRRVGDYLLLRLNVRGGFDSADEDIETGLQELLVTGQSLDGFPVTGLIRKAFVICFRSRSFCRDRFSFWKTGELIFL